MMECVGASKAGGSPPRRKQVRVKVLPRVKVLLIVATLAGWPVQAQDPPLSAAPRASSTAPPEGKPEAPAPAAAQEPANTLPVSIDRVREALKKKPSIVAPVPKADFTVHIEERRPLQEMFYVPPWATSSLANASLCAPRGSSSLPPPTCGLPMGVSVDPGHLVNAVTGAFKARAARDEVRRTIIEYCAAQPNGGAGIKICADEAR